jgi:hypothetical protein
MKLTTQKVTGILRKAGCSFSQYHASKMVRGWGNFSDGYKVSQAGNVVRVDYHGGPAMERLEAATRILRAAGLDVEPQHGMWLRVAAALDAQEPPPRPAPPRP